MKKYILMSLITCSASTAIAQGTYLNERMFNTSSEIYGTARYVGMAGAMGALGADMSCMSYNPAGIGLYRRNDLGLTAGLQWNTNKVEDLTNTRGSFDQIGFVWSNRIDGDNLQFLNVGLNYQKKLNFGQAFLADNVHLNRLSQLDQLADLASWGCHLDGDGKLLQSSIVSGAVKYGYISPVLDSEGNHLSNGKHLLYENLYDGQGAYYTHDQWGGLNSFDINLSTNIGDRFYLGLTTGFDFLKYHAMTSYCETSRFVDNNNNQYTSPNYSLYNDVLVDGHGLNFKFGMIVRPFEESPLRFGIAMETPTWYQISSNVLYSFVDEIDGNENYPNEVDDLDYSMRTPIKGRLSAASTVGNYLAWDVDWEFANYGKMNMGYPMEYNYDGSASLFRNTKDIDMNLHTKETLHFQHTLRAGVEAKPSKDWAFRLGYSYTNSPYANNVSHDVCSINSWSRDFLTNTSYMRVGDAHTLTLGLGYKYKKFYIDMAYKVRAQKADFYHFDDQWNVINSLVTDASGNPVRLSPTEVNLGRQQMTWSMGWKF